MKVVLYTLIFCCLVLAAYSGVAAQSQGVLQPPKETLEEASRDPEEKILGNVKTLIARLQKSTEPYLRELAPIAVRIPYHQFLQEFSWDYWNPRSRIPGNLNEVHDPASSHVPQKPFNSSDPDSILDWIHKFAQDNMNMFPDVKYPEPVKHKKKEESKQKEEEEEEKEEKVEEKLEDAPDTEVEEAKPIRHHDSCEETCKEKHNEDEYPQGWAKPVVVAKGSVKSSTGTDVLMLKKSLLPGHNDGDSNSFVEVLTRNSTEDATKDAGSEQSKEEQEAADKKKAEEVKQAEEKKKTESEAQQVMEKKLEEKKEEEVQQKKLMEENKNPQNGTLDASKKQTPGPATNKTFESPEGGSYEMEGAAATELTDLFGNLKKFKAGKVRFNKKIAFPGDGDKRVLCHTEAELRHYLNLEGIDHDMDRGVDLVAVPFEYKRKEGHIVDTPDGFQYYWYHGIRNNFMRSHRCFDPELPYKETLAEVGPDSQEVKWGCTPFRINGLKMQTAVTCSQAAMGKEEWDVIEDNLLQLLSFEAQRQAPDVFVAATDLRFDSLFKQLDKKKKYGEERLSHDEMTKVVRDCWKDQQRPLICLVPLGGASGMRRHGVHDFDERWTKKVHHRVETCRVPPACARLAGEHLMHFNQKRYSRKIPEGEQMTHVEWEKNCMAPEGKNWIKTQSEANCRVYASCFRETMKHMCRMTPECCPTSSVHIACRRDMNSEGCDKVCIDTDLPYESEAMQASESLEKRPHASKKNDLVEVKPTKRPETNIEMPGRNTTVAEPSSLNNGTETVPANNSTSL